MYPVLSLFVITSGFLPLLEYLTDVGDITKKEFLSNFVNLNSVLKMTAKSLTLFKCNITFQNSSGK